MTSLWNQPAGDLLRAASSHQATPGGAGTAALSAAFGTALVHMAAVITLQKSRKAGQEPGDWPQRMAELQNLLLHLRHLADQDVEVFGEFVAATRLPRNTSEQQQARAEALSVAGDAARHTPLEIARTALAALRLAEQLLPGTHASVTSDVGAGAALLRGAVDAALLTLEINLRRLTPEQRRPLEEQRDELSAESHAACKRVLHASQARIQADNA